MKIIGKRLRNLIVIVFSVVILLICGTTSNASSADFSVETSKSNKLINLKASSSYGDSYVIRRYAYVTGTTVYIPTATTYQGSQYTLRYTTVALRGTSGTHLLTAYSSFTIYAPYSSAVYSIVYGRVGGTSNPNDNPYDDGYDDWGSGGGYVPPPDTTPPTCSVSVNTTSLTNAASLSYSINFSESVYGFDSSDISLGGGGSVAGFWGSGSSYGVTVNTSVSDYTQSLSVGGSVCTDGAGNGNYGSNTVSTPVDRIKPAITFQSATSDNRLDNKYAKSSQNVTVKFKTTDNHYKSEWLSAGDITVKAGGKTINPTKNLAKQAIVDGSGNGVYYTLTMTGLTGDGDLEVIIPAGRVQDSAGNQNDQASNSGSGIKIIIDNTKPKVDVASISSLNKYGYVKNGERVTLKITFSENIYNIPSVKIGGRVATVTGSKRDFVATYDIPPKEIEMEEGELSIEISEYYDVVELYGDTVTKTTDGSKIIYDRTPPKIDGVYPNGNTTWKKEQSTVISATDNFTARVDIFGQYDWILDGNTPLKLESEFVNDGKMSKNTDTGKYRLYAEISDLAGNITNVITEKFYIDNSVTRVGTVEITKTSKDGEKYITHVKSGTDEEGGYEKQNLYIHKVDGSDDESGHKKTVYQVNRLEDGKEIAVGEPSIEDTIIETDGDYKITVTTYDNLDNTGTRVYIIHKGTLNVSFEPNGNKNYEKSVSTIVSTIDTTGLKSTIYYEWVEEGKEPQSLDKIVESGKTVSLSGVSGVYNLYVKVVDEDGNINTAVSNKFYLAGKIETLGNMMFKENDQDGADYTPNTYTNQNVYMKIENEGKSENGGKVTSTYKVSKKTTSGQEISIGEYSTESTVLTKSGEYVVTLTSTSELGASGTGQYIVKIDKDEPTIGFKNIDEYDKTGYIDVNISDQGDCISGVDESASRYYWTRSNRKPTENDFYGNEENGYRGSISSTSASIKGPANVSGIWYLWVLAKDNAGNVAIKSNVKIDNGNISFIDNEPPIAGTLLLKENDVNGKDYMPDTFTAQNVYIQLLSGYDADSGVKFNSYSITKDGNTYKTDLTAETTLTEHGLYVATVTTIDNQNNKSTREYIIKVDKQGPQVTFIPNGQAEYVKQQNVEVKIEETNQSGVNNSKTSYKWLGYDPTKIKDVEEILEKIKEIVGQGDESNYVEQLEKLGIYLKTATVTNGQTVTPSGATGIYHLYVYAEDNVGNKTIKISEGYKLDNTNPTKPNVKAYIDNENYYGELTNKDVTVIASGSESLSGVDKYQYSISKDNGVTWSEWKDSDNGKVVISEEGTILIKFKAIAELKDGILESEESDKVLIRIDKTGPKATFANYETAENGTTSYVKDILVRITLVDEGNTTVNANTLKYEWVKFASVSEYNSFYQQQKDNIAALKDKMTNNAISFANGEEIPSPRSANGIYVIFVYAQDNAGNESVNCSNVYRLGEENSTSTGEYEITGEYVKRVLPQTKVEQFKETLKKVLTGTTYTVYDKDGKEMTSEQIVTTASTVTVDSKIYKIAVIGDLNADGELDIIDLSKIQQHILEVSKLQDEYKIAADINNDGETDLVDLSKMMQVITGVVKLN